MSTYVIGDVQGCCDALMDIVKKIKFNPNKDTLIFCGDLVNRGGQSLDVLRWVYAHQNSCQVVLGNHDLSLLAQYYVVALRKTKNQEFKQIYNAPDCHLIMSWLIQQKLLLHKKKYNKVIVHAGIYPLWSLKRAKKEAKRVQRALKRKPVAFFKNMYGAKPNHWSTKLTGFNRIRFTVNVLTRMRYLYKNNGLNFQAKGEIRQHANLIAWFNYKPRKKIKPQIVFGHWSALGLYSDKNVICLDTGKVWGGKLTALKLHKSTLKSNKKSKHIVQS